MTSTPNPEGPVRPGGRATERGQAAAPESVVPDDGSAPVRQVPETGPVPISNEDDSLLFGPTTRPNEHVTTGSFPPGKMPPPTRAVTRALPALVRASKDPDASPQLKEMVRLLMYYIENS